MNNTILALLLTGFIATVLFACSHEATDNELKEQVDMIIKGAKIYTSNNQQPWAEALVIDEGKFVYVGNAAGLLSFTSTQTVELNGQLIIPGLIDGHSHPGYVNVEQFGYVEGDTAEKLLAAVKTYAEQHPDQEWLRLCCWPTDMFVHGSEGPRKELLDQVVPNRLVWFESATAHDYWLNSKALQRLGIDKHTIDPKPGLAMYARDEQGEPTGWLKEGAGVMYFATHFALLDETRLRYHKESVAKTLKTLSQHGVTALFDAGNKGFGDLVYGVVSQLEKEGRLPLRYYGTYQIFTPERAKTAVSEVLRYRAEYGSELLQFNSVKLFMDGITANQSAAYTQAYSTGKSGTTLLDVDQLIELLLQLHQEKLDLMVHTIGDLSVRTVLDAIEAVRARLDEKFYPRVTIAHLQLIEPRDVERIKELDVIANFTPWWMGVDAASVDRTLLGKARYARTFPTQSVFKTGAVVSFSSDEWWGGDMLATYVSPYLGIQVGHTRQYPKDWWESENDGIRQPADERLDLQQLLQGYTQNGAYQLRRESDLGSIEVGKLADLVVLNQNLFDINKYEIWKTQPIAVIKEGTLIQGELSSVLLN